jgi:hypothetical protein
MLMAILFNSLVGAVLGNRFKVRVLFPVAPIAFIITVGVLGVARSAFAPALLAGLASVVALQIGFLGGLFTRFSVAASRVPPERPVRSSTTARG